MPYSIVKGKGGYYVYKQGEDGKPVGEPHNKDPYPKKSDAAPLLRALYAAAGREAHAEFDTTILNPAGNYTGDMVSQIQANYRPAASPEMSCATCAFFTGQGCQLVSNQPEMITAEGVCDYFDPMDAAEEGEPAMPEPVMPNTMMAEMRRAALEDTLIQEFRGAFPKVPDAPGINRAELLAGDSDPVFVTRPIAQVGRVSKNGVLYDSPLVQSILEQINAKKPGALFGHLKSDDRATQFPLPSAMWIGAILVGETLWAKAYIRERAAADYVKQLKAVNGAIGTSIYGTGRAEQQDGATVLRDFVLETLDFAPPERASLDMGRDMLVTSEMSDQSTNEDIPMNKDEMRKMMAEMPDDEILSALGSDLCGKVAEAYAKTNGKKLVAAELATVEANVVAEYQNQTATIAELTATISTYQQKEFTGAIAEAVNAATPWQVQDERRKQELDNARKLLRSAAQARLTNTLDVTQVAEAVQAALTENQPLMEMLRDRFTGGAALYLAKDNRAAGTVEITPEQVKEAQSRTGIY